MPRICMSEFRRPVLDLVASGRKVAEVAKLLGISEQTHVWRARRLMEPGVLNHEQAELAAARKRITKWEAELPSPAALSKPSA